MKILFSKISVVGLILLCLMGCESTMQDAAGNTYPTVKIGDQIWMAKNMMVKTAEGSMCYENDLVNCVKYGRLYSLDAAKTVCPAGWHLPSREEFVTFLDAVKVRVDQMVVQKKLNAEPLKNGEDKISNHLKDASWGFDTFGFSALPAGFYSGYFKKFRSLDDLAGFWSSADDVDDFSFVLYIGGDDAIISSNRKGDVYSVRCIKDAD